MKDNIEQICLCLYQFWSNKGNELKKVVASKGQEADRKRKKDDKVALQKLN